MGSRYFITGVQLGLLMSTTNEKTKMEILQEIMDEQYLGEAGKLDLSLLEVLK